MNPKTRTDSVLLQLSADEQAQIYEWLITLGYNKTIEKMALPRPDGLNTHTHRASLHRFFKRYQKDACTDDLAVAKESRPISTEDASLLFSDAESSFLHAAHQLATGPMNPDTFAKTSQWLQSHKDAQAKVHYLQLAYRQLALAEKRHAFNREKFELDVARLALQHAAELQRLHSDNTLEVQKRIQAARELLYGGAVSNEK